jgi:hypothetical protein
MNICAKINSMAEPNGIVIGGALYQTVKSFSFIDKYQFREVGGGYSIGFSHKYPVYIALSKNNNTAGLNINNINQLFGSTETPKIKNIEAKQQSSQLLLQDSQQKQEEQQRYSTNIMIVDDEPDALFTYKCLLSVEGYNVQAFTDPQKALKHLSNYQILLLITN